MAEPVNVKGTAVNSTLRFLADKYGAASIATVTENLPPEERDAIRRGVLVSHWYRFSTLAHMMREARRIYAGGDAGIYKEMGRASADYALTTIYKIFFKVGSPQFIITRAASVYGSYYSAGGATVTDSGRGVAILELQPFPEPCEEYCHRIWGWVNRMLELSGATRIDSRHAKCQARGDAKCVIDGRWAGS